MKTLAYCAVCGKRAQFGLVRFADWQFVCYCGPSCALEDIRAAMAPAIVDAELVESPQEGPQPPPGQEISPPDESWPREGAERQPGATSSGASLAKAVNRRLNSNTGS